MVDVRPVSNEGPCDLRISGARYIRTPVPVLGIGALLCPFLIITLFLSGGIVGAESFLTSF